MDDWGRTTYGDPCRGCGFGWGASVEEGVAPVSGVPRSYALLLADAAGDERHPTLPWSVTAYVCQLGTT